MRFTIIGKALTGFLLIAITLGFAIAFMYKALENISSAVDHVDDPSLQLNEWKSAVNLINEADINVRKWNVHQDQAELFHFDSCRILTEQHIANLLRVNGSNKEGKALIDSLDLLSTMKFELLGNWISFSDSIGSGPSMADDILKEMAEQESKSNPEIDSTTLSSEQLRHDTIKVVKKDKKFWRRHFFKKRNIETDIDSIVVQTEEPFDKEPAVIEANQLMKTIRMSQAREMSELEKQLNEETVLLKTDQAISGRIYDITSGYEKLINLETTSKVKAATEAAASGTRSVTMLMITIACACILLFMYFIKRDVDRDKELKKQMKIAKENSERLALAKEEFLANMSHEIRNPLNIISGFSDRLSKSKLDDTQRLQVEGLSRSAAHLVSFVNDVLDFSKMKSGKFEIENIPFITKDIFTDLDAAFGTMAINKGIKFHITVSPDVPEVLCGDPVRKRQILYNLASNAVKFTDKGNVTIDFQTEKSKDGKELLVIIVSDTGIGIPPEKINMIFDEFTQADSSITRRYGGSGLGLSITRFLVDKMNGTIHVESKPEKGTTFTVKLPMKKGELIPAVEDNEEVNFDLLKGKTVLVCDDEQLNRILAMHILNINGIIAMEAASGNEALKLLEKESPDIVLMDLQMPDLSGTETTELIRKSPRKEISSVKIIAVTGHAFEEFGQQGMNGYIQKPYKEKELLKELCRVLKNGHAK